MKWFSPLAFVAGAIFLALPAGAVENTGVARLSVIAGGSVVIRRGDDQTELAGTVNAPILPGDYVATQAGGQAEIQLDGFTMLRLAPQTQIRLANNDASTREVQLAAGSVILSIAHEENGISEIDTPSVSLQAVDTGAYRVDVTSAGTTVASARSGQAEIVTPQQRYPLAAGRALLASGQAANPSVTQTADIPHDALDAFSTSRDRMVDSALDTDSYVPSNIAGYDDLNAYGNWINVAPYGMVWSPYVPAGWAPYRNGSWVWEDGFGWTWVALEPWGWAPFHYGYWFDCAPNGWCWYPPGLGLAPVWYPAVVGWFGFGDYWGPSLGFQYWGWVPLWPYEPFYPWYPGWGAWHSHPHTPPPHRISANPPRLTHPAMPIKTHAVYGSHVGTTYRNMAHGASGISGTAFRSGNFSAPVPIDAAHLKSVTVLHGALPLTPTAANLRFARTAPKVPVHWSHEFAGSHFAASPAMPHRTQFPAQQRQVHETLHQQSHAIVPAKPQTPPASQIWQQFENSRRYVPVPRSVEPHPYQPPVSTPVHPIAAPPHPIAMPPHPPAPVSHPPPAPHPVTPSRPPESLDWQNVSENPVR